jgi:hypothetical protein
MVQSEAQKRAKAKYYRKLKENLESKEASAKRTKNIILIIKRNIWRAVSNTMQKTKKNFYIIQKIKERRIN